MFIFHLNFVCFCFFIGWIHMVCIVLLSLPIWNWRLHCIRAKVSFCTVHFDYFFSTSREAFCGTRRWITASKFLTSNWKYIANVRSQSFFICMKCTVLSKTQSIHKVIFPFFTIFLTVIQLVNIDLKKIRQKWFENVANNHLPIKKGGQIEQFM